MYGVPREVEHYGCMIDMLARAGLIKEAKEMIEVMSMEADEVVWGALLGGFSALFLRGVPHMYNSSFLIELKGMTTDTDQNLDLMKEKFAMWLLGEDMSGGGKGVSSALALFLLPSAFGEQKRKWLQYQKDSVHQVLKAAMAINAQVLTEMQIPESYIEALPKNVRASLGDAMYKSITDDFPYPDVFLSSVDFSFEHRIFDLKNKIEASVVIWERKMNAKDSKSPWGSAVSMEKREITEDRAETILLILKHGSLNRI
ncbi:hypothetical protein C2S51_038839 [Perilla frutescens var. frutescens]|nr:hypothetical protein C2S51_038839 [Perilla frutescens var. frutescens]